MEQYIGKECKIMISIKEGIHLIYIARVKSITNNHLSFLDKFNKEYTFKIDHIMEICEI